MSTKAIREALDREDIAGYVYNVRDRELQGWDGPRVKAWGEASAVVEAIAQQPAKQ